MNSGNGVEPLTGFRLTRPPQSPIQNPSLPRRPIQGSIARVRLGPELFPGIRVPPGSARSHGMYIDARWSLLFNGNTGPRTVPVDASIRTYILGGGTPDSPRSRKRRPGAHATSHDAFGTANQNRIIFSQGAGRPVEKVKRARIQEKPTASTAHPCSSALAAACGAAPGPVARSGGAEGEEAQKRFKLETR